MTQSPNPSPSALRTIILTTVAMIAFAANSVLCRQALGEGHIDAASFTSVRMIAGAATLLIILLLRRAPRSATTANWKSAMMLFTYMAFFSFAYISLGAGTGALLLFGAVQLTMFSVALFRGEHFSALSWAGLLAAIGGLVYLVSPGVSAPNFAGAAMMIASGIAWGVYSLMGKASKDPLEATARNFIYGIPLVLIVSALFWGEMQVAPKGFFLALASGALASGCGYVLWYAVLPHLTATRAATVQLTVPAIAALGGVLLLAEPVSERMLIAAIATLGGVALVLTQRNRR